MGPFCCSCLTIVVENLLLHIISDGHTTPRLAEGIMADLWRDFWIRETGTGQQVAQIHDRYMMMMMMSDINVNNYMMLETKSEQRTLLWRNVLRNPKPYISAPLNFRRSNSLGLKDGSVLETTFHVTYSVSKPPWSVNWLLSTVVHFVGTNSFFPPRLLVSLLVIQHCSCTLAYLRPLLSDII
jgi:hypothetical protein